ncbi:MAG: hypothetical protein RSD67_08490, partial [Oscillospiraceae bacterium]
MKKKLSLLLVLAMAVSCVPATSFAATTNRLSKTVSSKKDLVTSVANCPYITFEDKGDTVDAQTFMATLTNAEWLESEMTPANGVAKFQKITAKEAIITLNGVTDTSEIKTLRGN